MGKTKIWHPLLYLKLVLHQYNVVGVLDSKQGSLYEASQNTGLLCFGTTMTIGDCYVILM